MQAKDLVDLTNRTNSDKTIDFGMSLILEI